MFTQYLLSLLKSKQNLELSKAFMQLHILIMRIDRKITITEQEHFDTFIDNLNWDTNISIMSYYLNEISKIRKIIANEKSEKLVKSIAVTFKSFNAKDICLELGNKVAMLDENVAPKEKHIIELLTAELNAA